NDVVRRVVRLVARHGFVALLLRGGERSCKGEEDCEDSGQRDCGLCCFHGPFPVEQGERSLRELRTSPQRRTLLRQFRCTFAKSGFPRAAKSYESRNRNVRTLTPMTQTFAFS